MTDVIQLLETLGRRSLDREELIRLVATQDDAVAQAVVAGDAAALTRALGMPAVFACVIMSPEHDEPAREDVPDGDEDVPADPETRAA